MLTGFGKNIRNSLITILIGSSLLCGNMTPAYAKETQKVTDEKWQTTVSDLTFEASSESNENGIDAQSDNQNESSEQSENAANTEDAYDENKVDFVQEAKKFKTNVSYNNENTEATLSVEYTDGTSKIQLTDDSRKLYQDVFEKGLLKESQESQSNKLSFTTSANGVWSFNVEALDTEDNVIETQNVVFKILDIADKTQVAMENSQSAKANSADDNDNAISTQADTSTPVIQGSTQSKQLDVSYTGLDAYTWTVPSSIDLNSTDTLKVSATKQNKEANASLKIKVNSKNGFFMQSSTGRKGQYSVTANGSKVSNHGIVLETEENTQTTDLKFNVDLKNFPTSEVYNDTLTFDAQNGYAIGTVLEIEGYKLIVLSQTGANRYLVIDGDSIGNIQFQPNQDSDGNNINIGEWTGKQDSKRHDGMNSNTYEGSYIDNYLENTWYNSLPETLKSMIVETDIQQKAWSLDNGSIPWYWRWYNENDTMTDGVKATSSTWYYNEGTQDSPKWITCWNAKFREGDTGVYPISHWSEHDTGYNGQQYNVLKRHVFLPSLSDLTSIVNLDNPGKTRQFCKQLSSGALAHAWTRDARRESSSLALHVSCGIESPHYYGVAAPWVGVRPAFELDLTNLSSVVINGTAKYK